jgi:enolase
LKAVGNVNDVLGPAVIGMDPADQRSVDNKMIEIDGTKNKSNMGANGVFEFPVRFVDSISIHVLCSSLSS